MGEGRGETREEGRVNKYRTWAWTSGVKSLLRAWNGGRVKAWVISAVSISMVSMAHYGCELGPSVEKSI